MAMTEGAVVNILLNTPGGPAAGGPAGGAPDAGSVPKGKGAKTGGAGKDSSADATTKGFKQMGGYLKGAGKFFKNNVGLNFGLSSMLKQSQIFTSFIGVIFQLLGALVDVMLAPLIPLFFPVIRKMASLIPWLQGFMQGVYTWIGTSYNSILSWYNKVENLFITEVADFKAAWKEGPFTFSKVMWGKTWTGIQWIWDKIWTGTKWLWDQMGGLGNTIWNFLTGTSGRVFGFFVQAYALGGIVRKTIGSILVFIITSIPKILAGIGKGFLQLLVWGIKAIPKITAVMWAVSSFLLKYIFPGFGHIIVAIGNAVGRLILSIPAQWTKFYRFIKLQRILLVRKFGNSISGVITAITKGVSDMIENVIAEATRVKNVITKRIGEEVGKITQTIRTQFNLAKTALTTFKDEVGKKIGNVVKGIAKIAPEFFDELGKKVATAWTRIGIMFKWIINFPGRMFTALGGIISRRWAIFTSWAGEALTNVGKFISDYVVTPIKSAITTVKDFVVEQITRILSKLGEKLGNIPIIGKHLKTLGTFAKTSLSTITKLPGGVAKGVGGKGIGQGLMMLAKSTKAIPVLGAVATAGFGAVETYKNFKEYGWEVGLATASKVVAATIATGLGQSYAGLAIDLGGTAAIELWKRKQREDKKRDLREETSTSNLGSGAQRRSPNDPRSFSSSRPKDSTAVWGATSGGNTDPITAGAAAAIASAVAKVNKTTLPKSWEPNNSVHIKIETQNGDTIFEQAIEKQRYENEYSADLSRQLQGAEQV